MEMEDVSEKNHHFNYLSKKMGNKVSCMKYSWSGSFTDSSNPKITGMISIDLPLTLADITEKEVKIMAFMKYEDGVVISLELITRLCNNQLIMTSRKHKIVFDSKLHNLYVTYLSGTYISKTSDRGTFFLFLDKENYRNRYGIVGS